MEPNLDRKPVNDFQAAIEALKPNATGSDAAALLDNRVSRHVCLNWRAGRRRAPQWALQLLARKIRERATHATDLANHLDAQKERPGLKAGALNLAKWRARPKP